MLSRKKTVNHRIYYIVAFCSRRVDGASNAHGCDLFSRSLFLSFEGHRFFVGKSVAAATGAFSLFPSVSRSHNEKRRLSSASVFPFSCLESVCVPPAPPLPLPPLGVRKNNIVIANHCRQKKEGGGEEGGDKAKAVAHFFRGLHSTMENIK